MIVEAVELAMDVARPMEGLRLRPYLCPAGVPTVGYGHTRGVTLALPPITRTIAESFLREDMTYACAKALALSPLLGTSDYRLAAIGDFIFNVGAGAYKASTLRRLIAQEEWLRAEQQFARWIYGGGRKLPGLIKRRQAEAALFSRG